MSSPTRLKYTGATPGADSNDYILFDTVTAFPAPDMHKFGGNGVRYFLNLKTSQAGTLKMYRSESRLTNPSLSTTGVTWTQVYDSGSNAAPASTTSLPFDLLVEQFADFKIVWTNGGSAQATWIVDQILAPSRNPSV